MMDLREETKETLYFGGHTLYQNGKYKEATHYFRFLSEIQPSEKKNWMGLGASYQMQKEYKLAIQSYAVAATIDPKDPNIHMHAAECCFALRRPKEAYSALNQAEELAGNDEEKKKIASLRKLWDEENHLEATYVR